MAREIERGADITALLRAGEEAKTEGTLKVPKVDVDVKNELERAGRTDRLVLLEAQEKGLDTVRHYHSLHHALLRATNTDHRVYARRRAGASPERLRCPPSSEYSGFRGGSGDERAHRGAGGHQRLCREHQAIQGRIGTSR